MRSGRTIRRCFLAIALAVVPAPLASGPPQRVEAAGLDHLYIVLDEASFAAMRGSGVLADLLGRTDAGLPDYAPPPDGTDRVFFRGRQTYLEVFGPKNRFDEPVGKLGIAIGEDRADRFAALARRWQQACPRGFQRSGVEWTRSDPHIPWYDAIQCDGTATGPALSVWATVYRPEFARWQTGRPDTARQSLLASRQRPGRRAFDIVAVELDVEPALSGHLKAQLIAAGLRPNGPRYAGQGWTITLRPGARTRLRSIDLATDQPLDKPVTLGRVVATPVTASRLRLSF